MSEVMAAVEPEFILPGGFDPGDLVRVINFRDGEGQVCSISAASVVRLFKQNQTLKDALRLSEQAAEKDRAKVRRLITALADEVTR